MTDKAISPLRRRLIEDMTIRRLWPWDSAPIYPPRSRRGLPRTSGRFGHIERSNRGFPSRLRKTVPRSRSARSTTPSARFWLAPMG